ncbi:MAG: DNA polymerase III subunit beta [Chloroflexi bacterium]|nr:DNA polymerase III subunit beta [Chloroflexota bacterium]MCI0731764.1 DNA polymerase III subunit beta [Chloroflexota bacterium]
MKVTCNQERLTKALGVIGRAAGQRASLPILSHVLLAATQAGRLQLAATNLEISICCWISSQVEAGGAAAVPAQALGELVQRLPAEEVTLTVNEDKRKVRVTAGRVQANLNAADREAFPLLPGIEGETAQLPAKHFKELVNQVAFAAAGDGGR